MGEIWFSAYAKAHILHQLPSSRGTRRTPRHCSSPRLAPRLGMSVGFPSHTIVEMRVRFLITSAVLIAAEPIIPSGSYALVHEMHLIPCGSERICPGRRYGSSPLASPAHGLFPEELILRIINVVI